jgi:integrase
LGYVQHTSPNFPNTTLILNVLAQMKNKGKSNYSIRFVDKALTHISENVNLNNPQEVMIFIANKDVSNGYKKNLCLAYNKFCKYYRIQWEMPLYEPEAKSVKIPTKEKLEMLISSAGKILSIKLTISKETGLRPVELCRLQVKDIDLEQRIIYPTTAKHGAPRALKISNNLTKTLQNYTIRNDLNENSKLFKGNADDYGKHYRAMRNNLAKKLNDPTIRKIRLYDFRHFFATNLYRKTRDILFVKQQMGHKKIETTLIYVQLANITEEDEWICKGATTKEEAMQLIEAGFIYVTEIEDTKLFRKRK